jgi:hypothetical protein
LGENRVLERTAEDGGAHHREKERKLPARRHESASFKKGDQDE